MAQLYVIPARNNLHNTTTTSEENNSQVIKILQHSTIFYFTHSGSYEKLAYNLVNCKERASTGSANLTRLRSCKWLPGTH